MSILQPLKDEQDWADLGRISSIAEIFFSAPRSQQFDLLRDLYSTAGPMIVRAAALGKRVDPYFVDWIRFFSPIEMDAWESIRFWGVPFYPQYPVLNYFLDFADPIKKIALEVDGKDWHDKAKDMVRDERLWEIGWRVFRVTGAQAYRTLPSPTELAAQGIEGHSLEVQTRMWIENSVDCVVSALRSVYYRRGDEALDGAYRSLYKNRLVHFPIDEFREQS